MSLYRKKWFVYSWPLVLLIAGAIPLDLCALLGALSGKGYSVNGHTAPLLWYAFFIELLVEPYSVMPYMVASIILFTLSLLWWFLRPSGISLLFSLFVVCFAANIFGFVFYLIFFQGFWN